MADDKAQVLNKTLKKIDKTGSLVFNALCFLFFAAFLFFMVVRLPEVAAFNSNTLVKAMVIASLVALITCFTNPPRMASQMAKRLGLAGLVRNIL